VNARADTVRVFVAVGLSVEAREQLVDAVGRIRGEFPQGIQWANPDGIHLTLKFLGNISASRVCPLLSCLEPVAATTRPFPLELAGLGMFPNRRKPRVLWGGVGGDLEALTRLQQASEDAINSLGYPTELRPFRPHITLGRPRRTVSDTQLARIGAVVSGMAPPSPVHWQVESVEVMQSELHPTGARYTILGSVIFGAK
jgi:2'-5' RNA ligase